MSSLNFKINDIISIRMSVENLLLVESQTCFTIPKALHYIYYDWKICLLRLLISNEIKEKKYLTGTSEFDDIDKRSIESNNRIHRFISKADIN